MGATNFNDDVYNARMLHHLSTNTSAFVYDTDVKSGKVEAKVHELLDPSKLNKAGKNVRESFDSPEHPESLAIATIFDQTGSMGVVPQTFVKKLGGLMQLLVKKGYVAHPHILYGAVGDANPDGSEKAPLQIGQFEAGNEQEETLSKIYLEGMGGGQKNESYELAIYYMARHTDMDCLNKRGKKGYLFLIGDEMIYSKVKKDQVKRLIGDSLESDIPLADIVTELKEKFEVHWILPGGTSYFDDNQVNEFHRKLWRENFHKLEKPEDVCEAISTIIGLSEGVDLDAIIEDLKDIGTDAKTIKRTTTALEKYASTTRSISKVGTATGALVATTTDSVTRL